MQQIIFKVIIRLRFVAGYSSPQCAEIERITNMDAMLRFPAIKEAHERVLRGTITEPTVVVTECNPFLP